VLTSIVVGVCLLCRDEKTTKYSHFWNATVFWNGLMLFVLFGSMHGYYLCLTWKYDSSSRYSYTVCSSFANYNIIQFAWLMWAIGSMVPLWLGMRISLPNRKNCTIFFMKSSSAYNCTFWILTILAVAIYMLIWIVKLTSQPVSQTRDK